MSKQQAYSEIQKDSGASFLEKGEYGQIFTLESGKLLSKAAFCPVKKYSFPK